MFTLVFVIAVSGRTSVAVGTAVLATPLWGEPCCSMRTPPITAIKLDTSPSKITNDDITRAIHPIIKTKKPLRARVGELNN
jgi:hypothetical protein